MHHGDRGLDPLVDQVGEDLVELVGGEHALVGDRAARQRREVDVGLVLGALAQAEGEPLEAHPEHAAALGGDEQLDERRHAVQRGLAEQRRVGRHLAPAEDAQALLRGDLLDALAGLGDLLVVTGDERGAGGVRVLAGQLEVDDLAEEPVGDLHQDPGAVAGVGLGAGGTAVLEVAQRGQRLADDVVAGNTGHGGHEGDATRVVLVCSVVEPLGRRECLHVHSPVVGQRTWSPEGQPVVRRW